MMGQQLRTEPISYYICQKCKIPILCHYRNGCRRVTEHESGDLSMLFKFHKNLSEADQLARVLSLSKRE